VLRKGPGITYTVLISRDVTSFTTPSVENGRSVKHSTVSGFYFPYPLHVHSLKPIIIEHMMV
jgi:hypothetical protein